MMLPTDGEMERRKRCHRVALPYKLKQQPTLRHSAHLELMTNLLTVSLCFLIKRWMLFYFIMRKTINLFLDITATSDAFQKGAVDRTTREKKKIIFIIILVLVFVLFNTERVSITSPASVILNHSVKQSKIIYYQATGVFDIKELNILEHL